MDREQSNFGKIILILPFTFAFDQTVFYIDGILRSNYGFKLAQSSKFVLKKFLFSLKKTCSEKKSFIFS